MSPRVAASALLLSLSLAACHGTPASKTPKPPAPAKSAQRAPDKKNGAAAQNAAKNQPAAKKQTAKNDKQAKADDAAREKAMKREQREAALEVASDAQVLATMLAFSNADISYARIAAARSRNAQIRAFATRMISDHARINQLAMELVADTDIELEDNQTTIDLREISAAHRDHLQAVSGAEFDAAYIAGEAAYHEALLVRIDHVLLPASRHPELKKLVASIRPAVAAHFAQAEQIGQAMGVGNAGQ